MNEGATAVHEVTAELTPYDALEAAPHAIAPVVGRTWFMVAFPVLCAILGIALVIVLTPTVTAALFMLNPAIAIMAVPLMSTITAVAAVIGYVQGQGFAYNEHRRRFLAGMHRRGMPVTLKTRYAITPEALEIEHDRMKYRVGWNSISQVVETKAAWVLQVDLSSFCLPRIAFDDKPSERAFVAALLDNVSVATRERSADAVAFAKAD
ncbi:YcxB family protein [Croceicoccus ponticola]|uniref:YcxB family protein n=1 Tax=Croceicoccus ponticola TaxID=2217664 RepID=A0A437H1L7_9SPHN|nr:YcxB family protein [Croceicoccus ponticola]RVQ69422.1 YcxB family protein [Croceicoccus ponticola]